MASSQFHEEVDIVLEATAKGDTGKRLRTMTTVIVSMATKRFGVEEEGGTKQAPQQEQPEGS